MSFITREEYDAKLEATEELLNAQVSRIEAKVDTAVADIRADMKSLSADMRAEMKAMNEQNKTTRDLLVEYRADARASKMGVMGDCRCNYHRICSSNSNHLVLHKSANNFIVRQTWTIKQIQNNLNKTNHPGCIRSRVTEA